jgi:hypothetical protein
MTRQGLNVIVAVIPNVVRHKLQHNLLPSSTAASLKHTQRAPYTKDRLHITASARLCITKCSARLQTLGNYTIAEVHWVLQD